MAAVVRVEQLRTTVERRERVEPQPLRRGRAFDEGTDRRPRPRCLVRAQCAHCRPLHALGAVGTDHRFEHWHDRLTALAEVADCLRPHGGRRIRLHDLEQLCTRSRIAGVADHHHSLAAQRDGAFVATREHLGRDRHRLLGIVAHEHAERRCTHREFLAVAGRRRARGRGTDARLCLGVAAGRERAAHARGERLRFVGVAGTGKATLARIERRECFAQLRHAADPVERERLPVERVGRVC